MYDVYTALLFPFVCGVYEHSSVQINGEKFLNYETSDANPVCMYLKRGRTLLAPKEGVSRWIRDEHSELVVGLGGERSNLPQKELVVGY